jgi:hypothetical protein
VKEVCVWIGKMDKRLSTYTLKVGVVTVDHKFIVSVLSKPNFERIRLIVLVVLVCPSARSN